LVLYLSNAEVRNLIGVQDAVGQIEALFRQEGEGNVVNRPTTELPLPRGFFRLKAGMTPGFGSYGFKAYGTGRYTVFVYNIENNALEGVVDAYAMTEIRTAAVSAVGAKYMARSDSRMLGIIGTGREARAQVPAICAALPIERVKAYSRSAEHRETYAREMQEKLGIEVIAVGSGEDCVRESDIVVTMTNARDPVLAGDWLSAGTFICGVGATTPERRELDEEAVRKSGTIVIEHLPQAQAECGELRHAVEIGDLTWDRVVELKDVVSGSIPGRRSTDEITLFDTIGIGSEDVALATYALAKAHENGCGVELPL
jgi:ornithine cyclodeaminase/alanine dehydrogenase-like protein (mu-crystallin family)